jgi:hypothetical protein
MDTVTPTPTAYAILRDFGFPVAVAVALGWYIVAKDKSHEAERAAIVATHAASEHDLREVIRTSCRVVLP